MRLGKRPGGVTTRLHAPPEPQGRPGLLLLLQTDLMPDTTAEVGRASTGSRKPSGNHLVGMTPGRLKQPRGFGSAASSPRVSDQVSELLWTRVCSSLATQLSLRASNERSRRKGFPNYKVRAEPLPAQTPPLSERENHPLTLGRHR